MDPHDRLKGFTALFENKFYQELLEDVEKQIKSTENEIFYGGLPTVQSILLRDQLIGEVCGLRRIRHLHDAKVKEIQNEIGGKEDDTTKGQPRSDDRDGPESEQGL